MRPLAPSPGHTPSATPSPSWEDQDTAWACSMMPLLSAPSFSICVVQARLAQPDASGRYVAGGLINLKFIYDRPKLLPSQITLPAGAYGFVNLKCNRAYANRFYGA